MVAKIELRIKLYDYEDGHEVAGTYFDVTGGYLKHLQGWSVVGNGKQAPVWVDQQGLSSADQSFSGAYYIPCPEGVTASEAVQLQCQLSCATTGEQHAPGDTEDGSIAAFDGSGYVATSEFAFPTREFSVGLWLRSTETQVPGALFSYSPSNSNNTVHMDSDEVVHDLLIIDQRQVQVAIKERFDGTFRHPGAATGVTLNDGAWHRLLLSWRSSDGKLSVYKDTN